MCLQFHGTKSHVSAFLKYDRGIELHVSATFTFCGNVLCQVLAILSSFRHVCGTEMSSHVSVIFKSGRFRCCSFPLCFCNGFLIVKVTEENIEESYTLPAIEHHDNGRAPTIMWGLKIYFPAYRVSLDILSLNSIKAFCVLINNHTFYWTRTTTWNLPGPSGTRDCINIVNLSHRSPLFCGG